MLLDDLASLPIENVATATQCVRENEPLAHGDHVQMPRSRRPTSTPAIRPSASRHQTRSGRPCLRGSIETAEVEAAVAGAERTLRGHVILVVSHTTLPVSGSRQAVRPLFSTGSAARLRCAGGVAEERRVVELAVEQADAAVVAAAPVFGRSPFSQTSLPVSKSQAQMPGVVDLWGNTGCRSSRSNSCTSLPVRGRLGVHP